MAPLPSPSQDLVHILPIRAQISSIANLAHRSSSNLFRRVASSFPPISSSLSIKKRQTIVAIPTTYGSLNSGPSPGTIVGIVLGSVAGFLLVLWLLYSVFTFGSVGGRGVSSVTTEVVRERRGKSRATHSRSRSRRRVSETVERVEVRRPSPIRAPPPPPAPVPVERVIVEERREERRESRPPPVRRISSDEIIVTEEHSPPRKKSSRRDRESGGSYRVVDPLAYGGGGAPMREVSRKSSSRRSRG